MIAGLIMGLLVASSVGLIKLAYGKDAKIKILQIFLLITVLCFWSMSVFFLILDMAAKDYWLCLIISIIVPAILVIWIFISRRRRRKKSLAENTQNLQTYEKNMSTSQLVNQKPVTTTHMWRCDGCGNMRAQSPCEYCGKE